MTPFDCPNCEGKGTTPVWLDYVGGTRGMWPCDDCDGSGIDPELRDEFKYILKVAPAYSPEFTVTDHANQLADAVVVYWKERRRK